MGKNRNLKHNSSQNFILKGLNSIQVGLYILLGSYLLKSSLQNFLSDSNPMMMMSIEIIEIICLVIVAFVLLFSSLAIFFSSRRNTRKFGFKVWNEKSKKHFQTFLLLMLPGLFFLMMIKNQGYITYTTPFFLIYLGGAMALFNQKKKKEYYLLAAISVLLSALVFLIPTYWYSALLILGVGFLVYGSVVRK
tara:strand:- start:51975 stop:52550 length:576 start_codon:yes stop_codon:yes gene_type:complete